MKNTYIVTGNLVDERTVTLDESLSLGASRVRLTVELLDEKLVEEQKPVDQDKLERAIKTIRERQQARNFVPPSAQSIRERMQTERDAWDE